MRVEVERIPDPNPPISKVVISLSRDEAQCLYEVANYSNLVARTVCESLGSGHEKDVASVLHQIWSRLANHSFSCRRGR